MIDYSEITDGILAVVEEETPILLSLPDGKGERGLLVFPDYTQDNDLWIRLQDYQHEDWLTLVQLWRYANLHILQVIKSVDQSKLNNYWLDFEGNQVTLDTMIRGYIDHLKLHVGQIHELLDCPSSKSLH